MNSNSQEVRRKKERKMPKIVFTVADGLTPVGEETSVFSPVGLRTPFPIHLKHGEHRRLKLGISCNVPVIVVTRGVKQAYLCAPGEEIEASFLAAWEDLDIGEGERVADVYMVGSTEVFDVEIRR